MRLISGTAPPSASTATTASGLLAATSHTQSSQADLHGNVVALLQLLLRVRLGNLVDGGLQPFPDVRILAAAQRLLKGAKGHGH